MQIQTTSAKEAFIAGIDNGIKPLNAAALAYVDQVNRLLMTPSHLLCRLAADFMIRQCLAVQENKPMRRAVQLWGVLSSV